MAGAIIAAVIVGRLLTPAPLPPPPPPRAFEGAIKPRWLVDVGERITAPELVAHAPIIVGTRVLVAGSRIGYVALDRDRGAIAWRRPGGPALAAPLVLAPHDVVLVRECDVPIAAPAGRAVVACFDRLDPLDIAVRAGGPITATLADAAGCSLGAAAWQVARYGNGSFTADRGACELLVTLPDGAALRSGTLPSRPMPPDDDDDCAVTAGGIPWCQRVIDGASEVELGGVRLPGLSVLAAATDDRRAAVVVRHDATLRHDELYALVDGSVVWSWPLPDPTEGRATPLGLSISDAGVFLLFDTSWVAAFTAP